MKINLNKVAEILTALFIPTPEVYLYTTFSGNNHLH